MNNGYGNYNGYNNNYSAPTEKNSAEPIILGAEPTPPEMPQKPKKTFGAGTVAILLVACFAVSLLSGFGAGYLATMQFGGNKSGSNISAAGNDPSVIYQNISASVSDVAEGTVSSVVTAVENTVVEIKTEIVTTGSFFGQYIQSGAGSGVIITSDGYIVTNNHVIDGASNVTVRLKEGTEYKAKVIGADADSDLAVLKIEPEKELIPAIFGDSDTLSVGQQVVAVGNPLGELGGTVTTGIISALDREVTVDGKKMMLLQTDAAVNPGNSGGGLFNLKGELIGIVNAKSSGDSVEGLGFAIPAATASKTAGELIEFGYVRGRVDLGLTLYDVKDNITAMYCGVDQLGCYVIESKYTNDLQKWDRIVAVNGEAVSYYADIAALKNDMNVGDTITFTVVRNGKMVDVDLVCREQTSDSTINFET